jgi:hypothetical protein
MFALPSLTITQARDGLNVEAHVAFLPPARINESRRAVADRSIYQ